MVQELLSYPTEPLPAALNNSRRLITLDDFRSGLVEFENHNGVNSECVPNGRKRESILAGTGTDTDTRDNRLTDIEMHTNRLLDLMNELRSVADRAL